MSLAPDGRPAGASGLADLTFAARGDRTRLVARRVRPPLVVQRALYPDDAAPDMAFVYLANPTAGIFQGDDLCECVRLEPGARAHVTTQAATKVYAMPRGSACLTTTLAVGAGALLEFLPGPVIPFQDACYAQRTDATVEPGGTLIYGDIIAPGRLAMGESFAFRALASRLSVHVAGGPLVYHEAYRLDPQTRPPAAPGILGVDGNVVTGMLLVVTDRVDAVPLRDAMRAGISRPPSGAMAAAGLLPYGAGVGVRIIGRDIAAVRACRDAAWSAARRELLGVGLPPRRTW